jgi:hypothetical protein
MAPQSLVRVSELRRQLTKATTEFQAALSSADSRTLEMAAGRYVAALRHYRCALMANSIRKPVRASPVGATRATLQSRVAYSTSRARVG